MIEKKLVCFKKQENFDKELSAGNIREYSIVFIKDTQKIWTHGVYFSSLKEVMTLIAAKQGSLTAGLNVTIEDDTISAKDTTYTLSIQGNTITLTPNAGGGSSVVIPMASTDTAGLMSATDKAALDDVKQSVEALEEALDGTDVADKFAELAIKSANKTITVVPGADGEATDLAVNIDNKTIVKSAEGVLSVSPAAAPTYSGVDAIKVEGSETTKTISLKIAEANKVLSQSTDGLVATLKFIDNTAAHKIQLVGINDTVIAEFDYAKFIVDGMLDDADINEQDELVLTMNTAAGSKELKVNLAKYIDVYTAGNGIAITEKEVSVKVKDNDPYLEVTAAGVASKGIDAAISTAIEEAFSWYEGE